MAVDAAQTSDTVHIAILLDGHYFIGADNRYRLGHLAQKINPEKNGYKWYSTDFLVL